MKPSLLLLLLVLLLLLPLYTTTTTTTLSLSVVVNQSCCSLDAHRSEKLKRSMAKVASIAAEVNLRSYSAIIVT